MNDQRFSDWFGEMLKDETVPSVGPAVTLNVRKDGPFGLTDKESETLDRALNKDEVQS